VALQALALSSMCHGWSIITSTSSSSSSSRNADFVFSPRRLVNNPKQQQQQKQQTLINKSPIHDDSRRHGVGLWMSSSSSSSSSSSGGYNDDDHKDDGDFLDDFVSDTVPSPEKMEQTLKQLWEAEQQENSFPNDNVSLFPHHQQQQQHSQTQIPDLNAFRQQMKRNAAGDKAKTPSAFQGFQNFDEGVLSENGEKEEEEDDDDDIENWYKESLLTDNNPSDSTESDSFLKSRDD
jgi:hypothetical protein